MTGEERREKILDILKNSKLPLSGSVLAKQLSVSRQIIVQDIALLRAVNKNILSTNKGYVIFQDPLTSGEKVRRTIAVIHTDKHILDELCTIVDLGGNILDVVVEHGVYGQITCDLIINNRQDAVSFVKQCEEANAKGLNTLTNGMHYHTIEAKSEAMLDVIEGALDQKGYLAK